MNHPLQVDMVQGQSHLQPDEGGLLRGEGAVVLNEFVEASSRDELHGDVMDVFDQTRFMDLRNIGVAPGKPT